MSNKVKDLSIEELKNLISETVEEKLLEILGDPDWGLELREEVTERLRNSFAAEERREKGVSTEEVAKKLGLKW